MTHINLPCPCPAAASLAVTCQCSIVWLLNRSLPGNALHFPQSPGMPKNDRYCGTGHNGIVATSRNDDNSRDDAIISQRDDLGQIFAPIYNSSNHVNTATTMVINVAKLTRIPYDE